MTGTDFAALWKATAKKIARDLREVDLIDDALRQAVVHVARQRDVERKRADEAEEVLTGSDHTAAKYWRLMRDAMTERDRFADDLVKTGEDADRYLAERDTLRDAIRDTLSVIADGERTERSSVVLAAVRERLSRAIDTKEKTDGQA